MYASLLWVVYADAGRICCCRCILLPTRAYCCGCMCYEGANVGACIYCSCGCMCCCGCMLVLLRVYVLLRAYCCGCVCVYAGVLLRACCFEMRAYGCGGGGANTLLHIRTSICGGTRTMVHLVTNGSPTDGSPTDGSHMGHRWITDPKPPVFAVPTRYRLFGVVLTAYQRGNSNRTRHFSRHLKTQVRTIPP
jgi:hypothetical protein